MIIPLGPTASRRAGKHPKEDEKAWPPGGKVLTTVTGEQVCVRKEPDLTALKTELERLRKACPLLTGSKAHAHPSFRVCMPACSAQSGTMAEACLLTQLGAGSN